LAFAADDPRVQPRAFAHDGDQPAARLKALERLIEMIEAMLIVIAR